MGGHLQFYRRSCIEYDFMSVSLVSVLIDEIAELYHNIIHVTHNIYYIHKLILRNKLKYHPLAWLISLQSKTENYNSDSFKMFMYLLVIIMYMGALRKDS